MKTVLIVDDAAFMRMILTEILTKGGYQVIGEASNGVEAIQMYKEKRPDYVTLDITMPEKNGIDTLKEIMLIDSTAKVIMCSAMGQQSMVLEAIHNGATDFIVKPFRAERVLETLTKIECK